MRLPAAVAAVLLALPLVAQESLPHPARLRAAMRTGRVELSWTDDPAAEGGNAVYRLGERIDAGNFARATKLGTVEKRIQYFVDVPPDEGQYYYAVLSLSASGDPYQFFAAPGNATMVALSLRPEPPVAAADQPAAAPPAAQAAAPAAPAAAPAAQTATPASPRPSAPTAAPQPAAAPQVPPAVAAPAKPAAKPTAAASAPVVQPAAQASPAPSGGIQSITAQAKADSIVVSYAGGAGLRLVLYRGSAPILQSTDLLDASVVATFVDKEGSFVDYPVPGINYWYAILLEDELRAGRIELAKGRNATIASARVALTKSNEALAESSPNARTVPLPSFLLDAATGVPVPAAPSELPARKSLSTESEKALVGILALAPPVKRPLPSLKVLSEELAPPSGGEDYALSLIVTQKLIRGDWASSVDQLRKYLSLNRSEKATVRARFYLGQALAFSGEYRDAFFEFLSARSQYPRESSPWIEYVLAALR